MPLPNDPLRIGNDELYGTNVESYLEQRREAKRMLEEFDANGGGVTKVLYASWFYLAIAEVGWIFGFRSEGLFSVL